MNELEKYILNKGLEKASVELIKQSIQQDISLTQNQKVFWMNFLNGVSIAKDTQDILSILFNRRR